MGVVGLRHQCDLDRLVHSGAACRACDEGPRRRSIAFTSSIDFKGAAPSFSHYGVAKAAIVNLFKNMALELGPYNIRVNCASPAPLDPQQSVDIVGEELMVNFQKHFPPVPLGHRLGKAEDIAAAFA